MTAISRSEWVTFSDGFAVPATLLAFVLDMSFDGWQFERMGDKLILKPSATNSATKLSDEKRQVVIDSKKLLLEVVDWIESSTASGGLTAQH